MEIHIDAEQRDRRRDDRHRRGREREEQAPLARNGRHSWLARVAAAKRTSPSRRLVRDAKARAPSAAADAAIDVAIGTRWIENRPG